MSGPLQFFGDFILPPKSFSEVVPIRNVVFYLDLVFQGRLSESVDIGSRDNFRGSELIINLPGI